MRFFSQKRIQSLDFVLLIFLLVFGLFATSAFAQESVFSERFYTLLVNNNDDDIMEGLEMCSTHFRVALARTGHYQEQTSQETEELFSSCNHEQFSPDYIEQCVLESTQNNVDLVLILSARAIRQQGLSFEAHMIRTLDEATLWFDNIYIEYENIYAENEEVIVLAAQEACNQLATRLLETLDANISNNPTENTSASWSVFELVDVSPRVVTVNIDGVEVGITPNQFQISPGPHVLTLSAPGYASLERNINAQENNTLILNDLVLEPIDATITITSNIASASVIVDGQQVSTTIPGQPIQVEISPDSRQLEVQREGYVTWSQTLNLTPGQNETFNISLVLISEQITPEGFVLIPAGSFMMGSPNYESRRDGDEGLHEVTITRPFYMQTYEVTQDEWQTLMGNNPSHFSSSGRGSNCGSNCPVENVSFYEVLAYANAFSEEHNLNPCFTINGMDITLNARTIYDCEGYRLPTEAEWEYAARSGTTTAYYNGEQSPDDIAWYNSRTSRTRLVGERYPNYWGLYDMSGNVWEWCWDWYTSYDSSPVTDPMGPDSGSFRVARGGSWDNSASDARSAHRNSSDPGARHSSLGFRLVSSAP